MTFDPVDWSKMFGERAEQVTLHEAQAEAERRALEEAKEILRKRLLTATADHNGRHINERKWEWAMGLLESL
jgi:hypothetical protein